MSKEEALVKIVAAMRILMRKDKLNSLLYSEVSGFCVAFMENRLHI